jgi:hypothetical protein
MSATQGRGVLSSRESSARHQMQILSVIMFLQPGTIPSAITDTQPIPLKYLPYKAMERGKRMRLILLGCHNNFCRIKRNVNPAADRLR